MKIHKLDKYDYICGKEFVWKPFCYERYFTKDWKQVTCKNCLKRNKKSI